jgi:hypothetical protein
MHIHVEKYMDTHTQMHIHVGKYMADIHGCTYMWKNTWLTYMDARTCGKIHG